MKDWLLVLQIYFGVGLVVCLAVVTSHLWMKRGQAGSLTDALKSLNPSRQRFWYRVLEDVVVPGLAFILVWLVWPVAIGFKFFEMYVGETLHLFESVGPNAFRKQLIWGYAVCKEGRVERFMTAGWRR